MGYTTEFDGQFKLDKPLTAEHLEILRTVIRNIWDREPLDVSDPSLIPPKPDSYCQWEPTKDGTAIVFDGNEKFYDYTEWIAWLIDAFLGPWGYTLNGDVQWQGEEVGDVGVLSVKDNVVEARKVSLAPLGEAIGGWKCDTCGAFQRGKPREDCQCGGHIWSPVTAIFTERSI